MESILKGIMDKNFPNMGRYLDIQLINRSPQYFNSKWSSLRHIIKQSEIKEFKKNPEEKQRSPSYTGRRLNRVRQYTQSAEKTALPIKNTLPRKVIFQKRRWDKDFPKEHLRELISTWLYKSYWKEFFKLKQEDTN